MNKKALLFIAVIVVVICFVCLWAELSNTKGRLSIAEQQISQLQNQGQIEQPVGNPGRVVVEGFMKSKTGYEEA